MPKKTGKPEKFLMDTGLLFEINRKVLHPFGLALAVNVDDERDIITKFEIIDHRDDLEGIVYSEEAYFVGKEKFDKFMKEFGEKRLQTRKSALGYIEQELEEARSEADRE